MYIQYMYCTYITYILLKYNALDEFGTLARFVYIYCYRFCKRLRVSHKEVGVGVS